MCFYLTLDSSWILFTYDEKTRTFDKRGFNVTNENKRKRRFLYRLLLSRACRREIFVRFSQDGGIVSRLWDAYTQEFERENKRNARENPVKSAEWWIYDKKKTPITEKYIVLLCGIKRRGQQPAVVVVSYFLKNERAAMIFSENHHIADEREWNIIIDITHCFYATMLKNHFVIPLFTLVRLSCTTILFRMYIFIRSVCQSCDFFFFCTIAPYYCFRGSFFLFFCSSFLRSLWQNETSIFLPRIPYTLKYTHSRLYNTGFFFFFWKKINDIVRLGRVIR